MQAKKKKMQIKKKAKAEFVCVEASVYHCFLILDPPLVMSDGVPVWL